MKIVNFKENCKYFNIKSIPIGIKLIPKKNYIKCVYTCITFLQDSKTVKE